MEADGRQLDGSGEGDAPSPALTALVGRIAGSCREAEEWPIKVGAGVYAAVDYLSEEPARARALFAIPDSAAFGAPFRGVVESMSELLEAAVPLQARPAPHLPAAALAGVGLLVEGHVRAGRCDRLPALRPELHLMILLPFLDFDEAKGWVERSLRGGVP